MSFIEAYVIEWSFGPSPNNASDHRMYEIRIPKSQLTHYDSDEELGIIVGGYGTMSFVDTNYWVFSTHNINIPEQVSTYYLYYDMKGCIGPPPSDLWIYITIIGSVCAVVVVITFIVIKKKRSGK